MKLKSIRIHGFKSFADKIELDFKSNITAIVGPNGSGKSNIVDAIRWVLGEQSVKSLRGSKEMADIIFAGSETRNALKRAEVALCFDNTEHFLNTDFLDVEVKRIMYHTGENEYFINNCKVRLKDITSLFLDSGIGADSLNIISQGSIEAIVSSKPLERRVILESASKVLKYKSHKLESLKKLEKTSDNLEKVQLVIDELSVNLEPLRKQSEDARKYLHLQSELKDLEISLAAFDIKQYHNQYEDLEQKRKTLEDKRLRLETEGQKDATSIETLKTKDLHLEEELARNMEQYTELTKQLAMVESQKTILLERNKYAVDEEKLDTEYLEKKEREKSLAKEVEVAHFKKEQASERLKKKEDELAQVKREQELLVTKRQSYETMYQTKSRQILTLENQIDLLRSNIEQNVHMPSSVKNILEHPHLKGIHNTIGQLLDIPILYATAMSVVLSASSNFVVVDDESCAARAIEYLKEHHLGRVTFFPLTVIKGRFVSESSLAIAKKIPGFLGIASSLVQYDNQYQAIIENQLGNVFVTKDMQSMQQVAKALGYQYRVVSLDGEITHAGGSLTGGTVRKNSGMVLEKVQLDEKEHELRQLNQETANLEEELTALKKELLQKEDLRVSLKEELFVVQNQLLTEANTLAALEQELSTVNQDLKRAQSYKEGSVEREIAKYIEEEKNLAISKDLLEESIAKLRSEKSELSSQIKEEEFQTRQKTSLVNQIDAELHTNELTLNKLDVKLDYLLNLLSESYHLTYEKAIQEYHLDLDEPIAREKVTSLKKQMQQYKMVNLGSIEEYERIKTRYDFLTEQKQDLLRSMDELQKIIAEMDEKMVERLTTTFAKIEQEFSQVFTKMFRGGRGMLKLTDPDNILETGIEIIAEPPGKKLNNIVLLSGGEKTLTAIALLFSILNVFPVPFCVLDEVEAALDEANVDTFGKYLQEQKEKSEYILITHKKRTMEYADTLYGITMQEQGVSKIVSVKLEEANR